MIDFDTLLLAPCMQTFGEPVVYTAAGFRPLTIQAVFFRSSMQLLPMGGSGGQEPYLLGASGDITTREPALGVQLSQFLGSTPAQGDTAYIVSIGLLYQVKEVLPDGVGHARLTLTLLEEADQLANYPPPSQLAVTSGVNFHRTASSYCETITGDGVRSSFTITHNLGTTDVVVQVRDPADSNAQLPMADDLAPTPDAVTIPLSAPLAVGAQLRVLVLPVR